eukprot:CAMPEP_0184856384 /NCGR_PEP_ID=MMETSP0580-20130426/1572_1 /TAXON_ID=1118495 /ORGANISM="Dactyliosolen fragilissimus" /LENGTH=670 /DNA_ID=CAMNT_0027351385 /DNA_START=274 /DNA_END=2286 /DNA_ORIENTATION=+
MTMFFLVSLIPFSSSLAVSEICRISLPFQSHSLSAMGRIHSSCSSISLHKEVSISENLNSDSSSLISPSSSSSSPPSPSTSTSSSDCKSYPTITEVDVRRGTRRDLTHDSHTGRYLPVTDLNNSASHQQNKQLNYNLLSKLRTTLRESFLPEGVRNSYYSYIKWRILQRYISSVVHVIGTQSLLLGLGQKGANMRRAASASGSLPVAAALHWVLKDALGKIVRMLWASRMGRKFDSDAKRWRFRSSLLYATGNGLEVLTYVKPHLFLPLAAGANALKQMSMLTSSATRNALYNSFKDGRGTENIGDITAKGEAQIAVVDLLGIASGVALSRAVGISVKSVLAVWITLQIIEIFCMYKEIRSVVFSMLNFERMWSVVDRFVSAIPSSSPSLPYSYDESTSSTSTSTTQIDIPTPEEIAQSERIFLPPTHLSRRAIAFGSPGRALLDPDELQTLMTIFRKDKFMLVVGENIKHSKHAKSNDGQQLSSSSMSWWNSLWKRHIPGEDCHIVLHADANNADIVKSTLALAILRSKLAILEEEENKESQHAQNAQQQPQSQGRRSRDCMHLIQESRDRADKLFPDFLNLLAMKKWATPSRFMFGRVTMRAEWEIQKNPKRGEISLPTPPSLNDINNTQGVNGESINDSVTFPSPMIEWKNVTAPTKFTSTNQEDSS